MGLGLLLLLLELICTGTGDHIREGQIFKGEGSGFARLYLVEAVFDEVEGLVYSASPLIKQEFVSIGKNWLGFSDPCSSGTAGDAYDLCGLGGAVAFAFHQGEDASGGIIGGGH